MAKFAQRLRVAVEESQGAGAGRRVLLKTDLTSGHFSASDRYALLKEYAFTYAWALDKLGVSMGSA